MFTTAEARRWGPFKLHLMFHFLILVKVYNSVSRVAAAGATGDSITSSMFIQPSHLGPH